MDLRSGIDSLQTSHPTPDFWSWRTVCAWLRCSCCLLFETARVRGLRGWKKKISVSRLAAYFGVQRIYLLLMFSSECTTLSSIPLFKSRCSSFSMVTNLFSLLFISLLDSDILKQFSLNSLQNSFPFCIIQWMKVCKFQYHLTSSQAKRGCFLKPLHSQQLFCLLRRHASVSSQILMSREN